MPEEQKGRICGFCGGEAPTDGECMACFREFHEPRVFYKTSADIICAIDDMKGQDGEQIPALACAQAMRETEKVEDLEARLANAELKYKTLHDMIVRIPPEQEGGRCRYALDIETVQTLDDKVNEFIRGEQYIAETWGKLNAD